MSDQYGGYSLPNLPEHSAGTAITNPATDSAILTTTPEPARKSTRRPLIIGAAAALLVALGAGGYAIYTARTKPSPIEAAAKKCQINALPEDDAHTLTFRSASAEEDSGPDDVADLACVMAALNMPSRVMNHVGQTRALDGTQTDSWDDGKMTARWNYHPKNGVTLTFSDAK